VKDAYWFRHDSNATTDPKMMTLLRAHGWAGYGMFWRVVELMRDTEGYKLERSRIQDAAYAMRADELPQVVETCCSIGLFVCDETHIWSARLCRDMEGRDAQREAGRAATQKRWDEHRKLIGTYKQATTRTRQDRTGQDKDKKERAPFVHLKDTEWEKLVETYGESGAKACVEKLSAYKESKGKTYKSDAAAIRAWVIDALKLDKTVGYKRLEIPKEFQR
jgi:hypothetical protein